MTFGTAFEVVERGSALSGSLGGPAVAVGLDGDLVARWQRGEEQAFELLVARYGQKVFRLLLCMMGSREEAEDAAQETFLSLHRNRHRVRRHARFSTFVYRLAAKAARRGLVPSSERMSQPPTRHAGDDPPAPSDAEDAATEDAAESSVRVQQALDRLSPSLRFPLVLYDIEGLPYGEIARILGVAGSTVKCRIQRARRALRSELRGPVGCSNGGVLS